ncbi:MAG: TIGR02466 family protein [Pseudomonadota bacterium]
MVKPFPHVDAAPKRPGPAPRPGSGPAAGQAPGQAPGQAGVMVRNLFPTPIALLQLPDAERINDALEAAVLERERAVGSVQHSNLGGWQSPTDFPRWSGDAGRVVLETATKLADQLTADRQGRPIKVKWRMNAWANVNRSGHGNEFHTHPGAYWSASYYVRDGGCAADPALGGAFEIADPRGIGPAMLAPELAFATKGGVSVGMAESVRPVPGLLVMFPSWLSHAVGTYRGDQVRISIAMNLTPVDAG